MHSFGNGRSSSMFLHVAGTPTSFFWPPLLLDFYRSVGASLWHHRTSHEWRQGRSGGQRDVIRRSSESYKWCPHETTLVPGPGSLTQVVPSECTPSHAAPHRLQRRRAKHRETASGMERRNNMLRYNDQTRGNNAVCMSVVQVSQFPAF